MSNPQNPWTNISWSNTIADCDKGYRVKIGKQELIFGSKEYVNFINRNDNKREKGKGSRPVVLTFDNCLPEPFYGDPGSQVYLLGMNPGGPDLDFNRSNDKGGEYEHFCQNMLKHIIKKPGLLFNKKDSEIINNPEKYGEIINDIFENNRFKEFKEKIGDKDFFPLRPHVGDIWQLEMWKQLIMKLGGRHPNVFCVEFFPYHSTSSFDFPEWLPSYEYRNRLIQNAMNDHKLIIIMRNEERWYDIEFDGEWHSLKDYPNKIFLRNKRRIWLTPGNFVWEKPEKRIPMPDWVCQSIEEIIEKLK